MIVNGRHYRTVWMDGSTVKMIDQTKLPHTFDTLNLTTHQATAEAITNMNVRGAGAIGAAAGYALAQAALEAPDNNFQEYVQSAKKTIEATRPTAQNLFTATTRVAAVLRGSPTEARTAAVQEAESIADEDAKACKQIGLHGAPIIPNKARILTHCNAGWLAFVDWGSALSPIYQAARDGKEPFVYVDETRPRGQGSLTSWELLNEDIKHVVIADTAAGSLMQRKKTDMVIVGADRICAGPMNSKGSTGDTANKIGTYQLAVLAKENNIPFYVAAPTSTIDFNLKSGIQIPIEERHEDEVLFIWGKNSKGRFERVRIAPDRARAKNPAFDVTPGRRFITGFITEKGIFKPDELSGTKRRILRLC